MVIKPIRQNCGEAGFQIAGIRAGWAFLSGAMACQNLRAGQWAGLTDLLAGVSVIFVVAALRAWRRARQERKASLSDLSRTKLK